MDDGNMDEHNETSVYRRKNSRIRMLMYLGGYLKIERERAVERG